MADSDQVILTMKGISRAFPGVQALQDVDFNLRRGEIHALMGENGAGKSTLIKVLTGVEAPDTGVITLEDKVVQVRSPQHAQELGISTVYQEINLCPNLTVAENILIGREPRRTGRIDWKRMNAQAVDILERVDVGIDVTQTLGSYSVAIQQMVAIVRALDVASTKILILDEPTSSLDTYETDQLFSVMRKLKGQGTAIIFITHFIDQVYEISDRITILRNGKLVGDYDTNSLTHLELVSNMLGRTLVELDSVSKSRSKLVADGHTSDPVMQARQLGSTGAIDPFDLDLYEGEVVGFAGLLGSGRTEIANLLFGVDKPDHGTLAYNGKAVKKFSPLSSIERGVALSPEDRKAAGIVDELSVRENIVLAMQANRGWLRYLSSAKQTEIADKYIKMLNIVTPSPEQPVKNLSGGNQQKVILARWLATNPQVLILDEPTRGIDVGAKTEIQKLVVSLAEEGKTCIFISSELEEVLRTSDRIVVLRDQEKITELTGDEMNETLIMQTIAGS
ncbi:MAG: sugar ABC transporter ATP-binding protein [Anaerolineae bacterium]|nr:sugar ABC transporter ATP-binding protein [Anaerolineae bacterium]